MSETVCDRCGTVLEIGVYPFCNGDPSRHVHSYTGAISDDIPGGTLIDHGLCHADSSPRRFYSKSEIAKAAKEAGLTPFVRHQPEKGSDKSPFTVRWACPPAILTPEDEAKRVADWHEHEKRLVCGI